MHRRHTIIFLPAFASFVILFAHSVLAAAEVAKIGDNRARYDGGRIPRYEKFEVTFDILKDGKNLNEAIERGEVNPYWPYDPLPAANTPEHPAAVPAGVGITVDGLFLPPNETDWGRAIVQPAFYYTAYERNVFDGKEHYYPRENPRWALRFAPSQEGLWRFKIRTEDSDGIVETSPGEFTSAAGANHGFIGVGAADSRYFELSDGTFINFVGTSNAPTIGGWEAGFALLGENKVNLTRPWWQGSQGPVLFGISGQGGVPQWNYSIGAGNIGTGADAARAGKLFSFKLAPGQVASTSVNVKPNTKYRFSAWARAIDLQGTGDYGLYLYSSHIMPTGDQPLTSKLRGTTDWVELVAAITTQNTHSIGWLKVGVPSTSAGQASSGSAYFTDVSLREDLGNGVFGPNLINKPSLNVHEYVSQEEAAKADYQLEAAKRNNLYLKVVTEEKQDMIYSRIQANGAVGGASDNNVYAHTTHASRTYQRYFWRYLIARYGFATNVHSFEFCNEGDPFNGSHLDALMAMSAFFKANDPNRHLVTTSNWHSFPSKEMWEPAQDSGYLDWHKYIGKQTGSDLQYLYGWDAGLGACCGINGYYPLTLDGEAYHSSPSSLYIDNRGNPGVPRRPAGFDAGALSTKIAIVPGHTYTVSFFIKGRNLAAAGSMAGASSWIYPTVGINWNSGWWCCGVGSSLPGKAGDLMGTYDWTKKSFTATAPANAHYLTLFPSAHWAVGEVWFDDITIYDETAKQAVECPNGDFDSVPGARLDHDSALMTYSLGLQVGAGASRVISKPVIRGEGGISGDNIYGNPYKGRWLSGENQQLVDDLDGVWFRKLNWAQISPYAVIELYWWTESIFEKGLYRYSKAYQTFLSDIPLSNGRYQDASAARSSPSLRAWGQKDLSANVAHLWIDNASYTWKAVVDHKYKPEPWNAAVTYANGSTCGNSAATDIYRSKQGNNKNHPLSDTGWWELVGPFNAGNNPPLPPPVSGTITIPGLSDGYYVLEWWDTSTGQVIKPKGYTTGAMSKNGSLTFGVTNLVSDIAVKIRPGTGKDSIPEAPILRIDH